MTKPKSAKIEHGQVRRTHAIVLCSAVFFILMVFSVRAQDQMAALEFPDSIAYALLLDNYVVTGQYEPTHYKKALFDVDVIKGETIDKLGATQLDQALQLSPSIRIQNDPVLGAQVQMRGISASNVAILMDGIPIIGRLDGGIDISQIPVQNIERIEIVEGPLSNIYGNNAAGGVINIITKKTQPDALQLEAQSQVESIGKWSHYLSAGLQSKRLLLRGYGRYQTYDQYPIDSMRVLEQITLDDGTSYTQSKYPWNPKEQVGAGASLRYQFHDNHRVTLKYDFNQEDVSDYGSVRRPNFKPYANDAFYNTKRNDVALIYRGQFDQLFVDYTLGHNQYDRITEEKRYYLETMEFDSLLQFTEENQFKATFSRLNLAYKFNQRLEMLGGFHYDIESGSGDRIIDHSEDDSTTAKFYESALFGEIRYSIIPALRFSASARYTNHSEYGGQWTPSFMVKYDINDKLNLKLGFAQGYRSPSLKELHIEFIDINHHIIGNPDLQPERSTDWQTTLTYNPVNHIGLSFNAFKTQIKDQIALVEYEQLRYSYENVSSYDVHGFQGTLNLKMNALSLSSSIGLSYWSNSIDSDDVPSYRRAFDMNHILTYDFQRIGLGLTANYRLVGKQPNYYLEGETIQTQVTSPINYLDFSIQKSIFRDIIHVTGGVRNILDIQSVNVSGSSAGGGQSHTDRPSRQVNQGRNYFVQLSVRI